MGIFPKMKVYVQLLDKGCHIYENPKGDLFDLRAAQTVDMTYPQTQDRVSVNGRYVRNVIFDSKLIPLGVRILMPKGMMAKVPPRSGTYKNFHVILSNSVGQIDQIYNGPKDQWMANYIALGPCHIEGPRLAEQADYLNEKLTIIDGVVQGDRICQFEVVPSQKATVWQKLKWLFSNGVEIIYVDNIDTVSNRGGFSSSGVR